MSGSASDDRCNLSNIYTMVFRVKHEGKTIKTGQFVLMSDMMFEPTPFSGALFINHTNIY